MSNSPKRALSHLDGNGRARMVDVSAKRPTVRRASAQAVVHLSAEAFEAVRRLGLEKGDAVTVAKLAGIQAAKRTDELIPLCHALPIDHVAIDVEPDAATRAIRIVAQATTTAKTGIELEAMVAASIAAITLYDMVKAVDPAATITDVQLVAKTGGTHPFDRSRACAPPS